MASEFKFEYAVPLYRSVVCVKCKRGYDSHERMFSKTPDHCDCGERLIPLSEVTDVVLVR
jgi:hypothetical protein